MRICISQSLSAGFRKNLFSYSESYIPSYQSLCIISLYIAHILINQSFCSKPSAINMERNEFHGIF